MAAADGGHGILLMGKDVAAEAEPRSVKNSRVVAHQRQPIPRISQGSPDSGERRIKCFKA